MSEVIEDAAPTGTASRIRGGSAAGAGAPNLGACATGEAPNGATDATGGPPNASGTPSAGGTPDAGPGRSAGSGHAARADAQALGALPYASVEVADLWRAATRVAAGPVPPAGLAAGERPAADVEVLAGVVAVVEHELARRMHTAHTAGALPLHDPGGMLAARGWSRHLARRLARCGALADQHPSVAAAWAAGLISSEHLDPIAKAVERFTADELTVSCVRTSVTVLYQDIGDSSGGLGGDTSTLRVGRWLSMNPSIPVSA